VLVEGPVYVEPDGLSTAVNGSLVAQSRACGIAALPNGMEVPQDLKYESCATCYRVKTALASAFSEEYSGVREISAPTGNRAGARSILN
jgi:hypothetical protein